MMYIITAILQHYWQDAANPWGLLGLDGCDNLISLRSGDCEGAVGGVSRARVLDEVGMQVDNRAVKPSAAHARPVHSWYKQNNRLPCWLLTKCKLSSTSIPTTDSKGCRADSRVH